MKCKSKCPQNHETVPDGSLKMQIFLETQKEGFPLFNLTDNTEIAGSIPGSECFLLF